MQNRPQPISNASSANAPSANAPSAAHVPRPLQDAALATARLAIWNKKFAAPFARLARTTLQKVSASDEGFLVLSVYKPGDDRTSVLLSIRKSEPGITLSTQKPPSQQKPNSIVQIARKYLAGRRVKSIAAAFDPVSVIIEFDAPPTPSAHDSTHEDTASSALEAHAEEQGPDCLILDLDARPPRVCVAKRWDAVPERYSHVKGGYGPHDPFYESYCEWSLDQTKTKRRACFETAVVAFCLWGTPHTDPANAESSGHSAEMPKDAGGSAQAPSPAPDRPSDQQSQDPNVPTRTQPHEEITLAKALALLPTHVRRAARTRLQFLERRLQRQKGDMPAHDEITRLTKRAEGLRAHLYQWPEGSQTWYVPPQIIEETGLPAMMQLRQGQKPGDVLDTAFLEIEKLRRRQAELATRLAESEKALQDFTERVCDAGESLRDAGRDATDLFAQPPEPAAWLCQSLDVAWTPGNEKARAEEQRREKRLPYRTFHASTGEFIRVAKSASDGDAMLRLMPAHHTWVHVMTGEGSHVWLEKPKKAKPTQSAVREAGILAVHYSKQGRAQSADVYVATRADIEKRKDLAVGKVIVRRSTHMLVRYTDEDLQPLLASAT